MSVTPAFAVILSGAFRLPRWRALQVKLRCLQCWKAPGLADHRVAGRGRGPDKVTRRCPARELFVKGPGGFPSGGAATPYLQFGVPPGTHEEPVARVGREADPARFCTARAGPGAGDRPSTQPPSCGPIVSRTRATSSARGSPRTCCRLVMSRSANEPVLSSSGPAITARRWPRDEAYPN